MMQFQPPMEPYPGAGDILEFPQARYARILNCASLADVLAWTLDPQNAARQFAVGAIENSGGFFISVFPEDLSPAPVSDFNSQNNQLSTRADFAASREELSAFAAEQFMDFAVSLRPELREETRGKDVLLVGNYGLTAELEQLARRLPEAAQIHLVEKDLGFVRNTLRALEDNAELWARTVIIRGDLLQARLPDEHYGIAFVSNVIKPEILGSEQIPSAWLTLFNTLKSGALCIGTAESAPGLGFHCLFKQMLPHSGALEEDIEAAPILLVQKAA